MVFRYRYWQSLQLIAPRAVLQRLPQAVWEDVAYLLTYIGFKDRSRWPQVLGMTFEWYMWPLMQEGLTTLENNEIYIDIDIELGEDPVLASCDTILYAGKG